MTELPGGSTPAGPERRQVPEIEDFLSRAVDRQVAQQRALADALTELRQAVDALSHAREEVPDETHVALANALGDLRDAVHDLTSHARQPVDVTGLERVIRDVSEGEMSFMVRELKDLKESGSQPDSVETTERLRDLSQDVDTVRDSVGGVASDIDGIAQALIDLNSGLRGWADGVDSNIASLRDAVDRVHEVTVESQELLAPDSEDAESGRRVGVAAMGERIQGIEDRVGDTAELSSYLTEQVESLDKLLNRIGDLPMKLEGVVAQALRRTLATRAKLDKEAERAIDDVLGSVDQQLEQFNASLQRVSTNDDRLEKIEAGQSELRSQIEDLQKGFSGRFEALAQAIDRSAKGLSPRALDSIDKPVRRTSKTVSSKTARPKPKAKAKPKPPDLKPARKSRETSRKRKPSRRRVSPPIIELDDESLE